MAYKSLYAENKEVGAAQYICELVCKNRADSTKTELPLNFWRIPQWQNYYVFQMKHAGMLLKAFPNNEHELIKFVRTKKIWSLAPRWVSTAFFEYTITESKTKKDFEKIEVVENPTFPKVKDIKIDYLD